MVAKPKQSQKKDLAQISSEKFDVYSFVFFVYYHNRMLLIKKIRCGCYARNPTANQIHY